MHNYITTTCLPSITIRGARVFAAKGGVVEVEEEKEDPRQPRTKAKSPEASSCLALLAGVVWCLQSQCCTR